MAGCMDTSWMKCHSEWYRSNEVYLQGGRSRDFRDTFNIAEATVEQSNVEQSNVEQRSL